MWKVVVADDDEQIRALLVHVLNGDDFEVVGEAADGVEVVEVAAREQPDLVLLDWQMPGATGVEAIPHVREAAPATRVVVMSGAERSDVEEQALAAGAARFEAKGVDLADRIVVDLRDVMTAGPSS